MAPVPALACPPDPPGLLPGGAPYGKGEIVTLTLCVDRKVNWRPGKHVNQWSELRSIRAWWLWFAVAWYRFDDRHLVADPHEWSD